MISEFQNRFLHANVWTGESRSEITAFDWSKLPSAAYPIPDCIATATLHHAYGDSLVEKHGRACEKAKDMIGLPSLCALLEAT